MTAGDDMHSAVVQARAGDSRGAWALAISGLDKVGGDRACAEAFTELLTLDPTYPGALRPAEQVVAAFGADPELMIKLSAALLRVAEQRPPDEPPFEKGPAHLAAGAAQRCFEGLSAAERRDPARGGYLQINMADALRMMGPEHDADALQAYQLALAIDDKNGWWWFQRGLFHKWRGGFREALEANRKARSRLGDVKPVLWNIAIAATALGEGQTALEAWGKLGIEGSLSQGGLPFVADMPPMQIRVASMGEKTGRNDPLPSRAVTFEVLWVQPLSPCHGVLQTPSVRKASVDYGDLVLWDGAPVHMTQVGARQVPVFPLLWILRPGDEKRLRFVGMERADASVEALRAELGDGVELVVFDRRRPNGDGNTVFYGKLLVSAERELGTVRSALEAGLAKRAGLTLSVPSLYELLGDTKAAGKAHQAWGGIERAAEKRGLLPHGSG